MGILSLLTHTHTPSPLPPPPPPPKKKLLEIEPLMPGMSNKYVLNK